MPAITIIIADALLGTLGGRVDPATGEPEPTEEIIQVDAFQVYLGVTNGSEAIVCASGVMPVEAFPEGTKIGTEFLLQIEERKCEKCGCTSTEPCMPPCKWVEARLCSACRPLILDPTGQQATTGLVDHNGNRLGGLPIEFGFEQSTPKGRGGGCDESKA